MTLRQIIGEAKKTYNVGITPWRVGKTKELAMNCMVGDGKRQYACLYDYIVELIKVKPQTFKLKVNKPQPTLAQRFVCFYIYFRGL